MHACVCSSVLMHTAHAQCDCCEAMHACACLCVLAHKAHDHCYYSEAMHAFVQVFFLACTWRMLTVIAMIAKHACVGVCV
jgi:hypothetical protein